jgi:HlyD family secretion protein
MAACVRVVLRCTTHTGQPSEGHLMDIKREGVARQKRIKYAIYSVLMLALLGSATYYISKLKPASRTVEWATIWPGTVKRGSMLLDVKGTGRLAPEDIVFIPAAFESQVSKIMVNSGDRVKPDTVLMVLTNPDMELAANDLEWQIRKASIWTRRPSSRLRKAISSRPNSTKTPTSNSSR